MNQKIASVQLWIDILDWDFGDWSNPENEIRGYWVPFSANIEWIRPGNLIRVGSPSCLPPHWVDEAYYVIDKVTLETLGADLRFHVELRKT